MNQPDEDALWRSIVENYGERAVLDPGAATSAEPVDRDRIVEPTPDAERTDRPDRTGRPAERDAVDATDAAGASRDRLDAWDDPDDHFVPPEPPPLPRPAPPFLLAWAGVLGMPLVTVLLAVLHVRVPVVAGLLALIWFVGGFCFLVATMRRDRDDDDWDDGAVL